MRGQRRRVVTVLVCVLSASAPLVAVRLPQQQQQRDRDPAAPRFDVASVKVNRSGRAGKAISHVGMRPDGSFTAVNIDAGALVRLAYDVPEERTVGLPKWAGDARFDVMAKAPAVEPAGTMTPDRIAAMLRSLLVDRFNLATHVAMRDSAVYELRLARGDGRLGPGLRRSEREDCASLSAGRDPSASLDDGIAPCGTSIGFGRLSGGGVPLAQLASGPLTRLLGRPVLDRTGLAGTFDVALTFPFGETPASLPFLAPGESAPADPNTPTIFTSIQEQLGLKLVSARAPVPVLIVDHMERPRPD